jgi:hypothetical protein
MRKTRVVKVSVSLALIAVLLISVGNTVGAAPVRPEYSSLLPAQPGQEVQASSASLTILDGEVFLREAGTEEWTAITENTWVSAGDTIKTDQNGAAVLTFLDGTDCVMDPNTEMTVMTLEFAVDQPVHIKLHLWAGSTWHRLKEFCVPDSRYEVDTPSATLGARGTSWWVYVDENGHTWVVIIEGQVDIEGEYTLGMPEDFAREDLTRETYDGETVGWGVAAQAYFIAQELENVLSPKELEALKLTMKLTLDVDSSITGADLVNAFKSGTMTWGDIKKLTGNPSSSDGNLGMMMSQGKGRSDKHDKDEGNIGGNGGGGGKGGGKNQ